MHNGLCGSVWLRRDLFPMVLWVVNRMLAVHQIPFCLKVRLWYNMIWYDMVWYGMVWYDMVWSGALNYEMTRHKIRSDTKQIKAIEGKAEKGWDALVWCCDMRWACSERVASLTWMDPAVQNDIPVAILQQDTGLSYLLPSTQWKHDKFRDRRRHWMDLWDSATGLDSDGEVRLLVVSFFLLLLLRSYI